jgi:uncharacterized protein YycO
MTIDFRAFANELEKIAEMDLDRFKAKLQPGDIIVSRNKGVLEREGIKGKLESAFDAALNSFQKSNYTHAAMYVGKGKIVESRPGEGVTEKPLEPKEFQKRFVALRPDVSASARRRAAREIRKKVGEGYGYTALPRLLAADSNKTLTKAFKTHGRVCSTIVSDVYKGVRFNPDKPKDALMPKDLLLSDKTKTVAVAE